MGRGGAGGTFNLPFVVSVRMLLFPKKIYTQKKKKRFLPDEGMGEQDGEGGGRGAVVCLDTDFGAEIVCLCGMAISILLL